MAVFDPFLHSPGIACELYEQYRRDPNSVDASWAKAFRDFETGGGDAPASTKPAARSGIQIADLVHTFRQFGHLAATTDPLALTEPSHAFLNLDQFGFKESDLDRVVTSEGYHGLEQGTLRQHIDVLRETYCGPIGVEYMDGLGEAERDWLQRRMEPIRNRPKLSEFEKRTILRALISADAFEETLHRMYPGAKRFSLEGATTLTTLLETLIESAATHHVDQLVLGMAHRGRLNVLAQVMRKPLEYILAEFEGRPLPAEVQGYGDVKYHMGYSSDRITMNGHAVHLSMAFNPSHLEVINPVVAGIVRAKQDRMGDRARSRVVPILLHGDSAFTGQGIVAESLTLGGLKGYETGGTVHVIVNNQVGFTASPQETRATRYASDIAKIIRAPVFHINADHPEAVYMFAQLAMAYRQEFHRDVVIDLICYRKHGHNELDDASFTQPVMARRIAQHKPVSQVYAEKLAMAESVSSEDAATMRAEYVADMRKAREVAQQMPEQVSQRLGGTWQGLRDAGDDWSAKTAVNEAELRRVAESLLSVPEGFSWHKRLKKLVTARVDRVLDNGAIDWGIGEALAYGSLLAEGTPIRLSGQDAGRGTFSHRHAVYVDQETGEKVLPLASLASEGARFEVINSPVSEEAVLGFEYGYSTADPWSLAIWEAQFGDFVNGAQVIIDQLIASAEYKWGRMSGLTMLLPHGYEGQGPEHSSARLERFLELCAENNLQVVNLTTPAQFFHCVRRQVLRDFRKPLVVMSPKSLLRLPAATSKIAEFANGEFQTVIADPEVDAKKVRRVLLCSGKVFYGLQKERETQGHDDVAILRLEQLYPYPEAALADELAKYDGAKELMWVQEEPRNMGAWRNLRHRFEGSAARLGGLHFVGRDSRAVPATGAFAVHSREEASLHAAAFSDTKEDWVVRRLPTPPEPAAMAKAKPLAG